MINKKLYLQRISAFSIYNDIKSIQNIRSELLIKRYKMDRWFDKYLDMFSKEMGTDKSDTNIWKLYNNKCNEYGEINGIVKTADFYIKKFSNI